MEDVLDIYKIPYNPAVPVVYMDEKPYQLLDEAQDLLPMRPGDTGKIDSEYIRKGTCSIFVFVEPLGGVKYISVREHRTATDWAEEIKYFINTSYPDKQKIILAMDNLCHRLSIQDISSSRGTSDSQVTLDLLFLLPFPLDTLSICPSGR